MAALDKSILIDRRIKLLFFLGSLVLLFLVITQVNNMSISFLFAFVGFYLMAPLVDLIERRGLNRVMATTLPFLFFSVVIGVLIFVFAPEVASQTENISAQFPKYSQAAKNLMLQIEKQYGDLFNNVYPINFSEKFNTDIVNMGQTYIAQIPDILSKSVAVILMAPFLTFFMLLDGRNFVRRLITLVPNNLFELFLNLNHQISYQIGGFIRARLIESALVSFITWIGLLIIGFPYALVLAIVAGVLNIIPYVGPILGALPAVIISVANGGGSGELFKLFLIYFTGQLIDTAVLVPFLVAKIVNLHPVTVVLSILVGSQLAGIVGMIICIPVVSTVKVTLVALYNHFTNIQR